MIIFITIMIIIIIIILTHDYYNSNRDSFTLNFANIIIIIGNSSRSIVIMTILIITNYITIYQKNSNPDENINPNKRTISDNSF